MVLASKSRVLGFRGPRGVGISSGLGKITCSRSNWCSTAKNLAVLGCAVAVASNCRISSRAVAASLTSMSFSSGVVLVSSGSWQRMRSHRDWVCGCRPCRSSPSASAAVRSKERMLLAGWSAKGAVPSDPGTAVMTTEGKADTNFAMWGRASDGSTRQGSAGGRKEG